MVESQAIYNILENEAVPLFYTRSADNLPRAWIRRMKSSIAQTVPEFNTHRMLAEYTRRLYNPAAARWRYLTAEAMTRARAFAKWKSEMKQTWPEFEVQDVIMEVGNGAGNERLNPKQPQLKIGSELKVRALIKLGKAGPDEVSVQLYHGPVDTWGGIKDGSAVTMSYEQPSDQEGEHWFTGSMPCTRTGQHGATVRVLPRHRDLANPHELGLILWEGKPVGQEV